MKSIDHISSKKNSLLQTMTNSSTKQAEAKQKRLREFKLQMKDHYDTQIDPVDSGDLKDPQTCAEYASEIFHWLRSSEADLGNNNLVSPSYMSR